ncbi:homocysteine S-methyltransferase family protein [Alteromonas profundi]|nr:homocysteine S-methyltransferase family protein [Alteromonas profundi]
MNTLYPKVRILDGGMGRELERIGAPFRQPEWSALALIETPDLVAQAHQHFIDAGARIITTNTYALVPFHLGEQRFATSAKQLAHVAAQIARKLAEKNGVEVAGCIPPAFGSYKPELFDPEKVADILLPLIQGQEALVDFWLIETAASYDEALHVVRLLKAHSNKPVWLAFTLTNRDDLAKPLRLRSGETLSQIIPLLSVVDAVLFNCSQPEEMEDAIAYIHKAAPALTIGAYANSFSEIKREHNANALLSSLREDVTPQKYQQFAKRWLDAGATVIGGCCGIGPAHIKALNELIK